MSVKFCSIMQAEAGMTVPYTESDNWSTKLVLVQSDWQQLSRVW